MISDSKLYKISNLRPCPFCESNELFISEFDYSDEVKAINSITYAVTCYDCNARGSEEYTESGAVAKWNWNKKNNNTEE